MRVIIKKGGMMPHKEAYFGEVIESSLTGFVVQSWEWDHAPLFGSLVMIRERDCILFGVVHQIVIGSIDTIRTPFAYRKTHEELKREQPHIFEFLRTTCACVIVGYRSGRSLLYMMAPNPPNIHSFVSPITPELAQQFFSCPDYLYVLQASNGSISHFDELLLALIAQSMQQGYLDERGLRLFMNTYVLIAGNEYRRIKLFARRIQHIVTL